MTISHPVTVVSITNNSDEDYARWDGTLDDGRFLSIIYNYGDKNLLCYVSDVSGDLSAGNITLHQILALDSLDLPAAQKIIGNRILWKV